jgi:N-methylhydantoinase A
MLVGVDIGGTFTDVVVSSGGKLQIHKLLSTPHNPAEAMLAGLEMAGRTSDAVVSHGTTVATNAILERKGARTALLTTQGFSDVLAIGRQNRPDLYALKPILPPPLIPREFCYEVPERLDFTGQIITPLDIIALDRVIDGMRAAGIEAVAVCFLFSFLNPAHEQAARARLLDYGRFEPWQISLSCEVLPQFREYERASTVALDAYVRPIMSRYLGDLEARLDTPLRIMKSDGGLISAARARQQAVQTALSGPAAGVIGAFHLAKLAGYDQIITLDMGGTSTDVALCPGEIPYRAGAEIDGLPLRLPLVDIETVGAGGGSIASLDAGGVLHVGPASAGAAPGPIIYGLGGQAVTVSDANAVLGRLDADHFLGGKMTLHLSAAEQAIEQLATAMSLGREATTQGILEIANANIERAVRRVSIARGYDPREFTLVAFGGAGPLHACDIATRLDIPRVLIPHTPGVLCALGLLTADVQREYSRAILQPWTTSLYSQLENTVQYMSIHARADFESESFLNLSLSAWVDMRYAGQSYELVVPFGETMDEAFHEVHKANYGHALPGRPIEVVNLRLRVRGEVEKPNFEPESLLENNGREAQIKEGQYLRENLLPGAMFKGSALIFQLDSTIYIPDGWVAHVDAYHNLVLEAF